MRLGSVFLRHFKRPKRSFSVKLLQNGLQNFSTAETATQHVVHPNANLLIVYVIACNLFAKTQMRIFHLFM